MDAVETWIKIIERVGLPTSEIAFVGFVLWRFCRWVAPLAEKLLDRHISFMDTTGNSLAALSAGQAAIEREIYTLAQRTSPPSAQPGGGLRDAVRATLDSVAAPSAKAGAA